MKTVLVTGGAGFIGRHVVSLLLARGYHVRVVDSLLEQVHQVWDSRPTQLPLDVEFVLGDVRDAVTVARALRGVDYVIHLAAEVGVGQSMYAIDRYVSVNDLGTAVLLQQMTNHPVRRMIVASSMSVYGEGLYRTEDGASVEKPNAQASPIPALIQSTLTDALWRHFDSGMEAACSRLCLCVDQICAGAPYAKCLRSLRS